MDVHLPQCREMKVLLVAALLVLAGRTALAQDAVQARMELWSRALGVTCAYCHVDTRWTDGSKPNYAFALRMSRMLQGLNAGPLKEFEPITCVTCHRGQPRPARLPQASWQTMRDQHVGEFTNPNSSVTMSMYAASLGQQCSFCHEAGSFTAPTKPAYGMVAKMLPIFDEIPKYFETDRTPVTQCYMCHQGEKTPRRH